MSERLRPVQDNQHELGALSRAQRALDSLHLHQEFKFEKDHDKNNDELEATFSFGWNNYLETSGGFPSAQPYELNPAQSRFARFGLIFHLPFSKKKYSSGIRTGLELSYYNFMFDTRERIDNIDDGKPPGADQHVLSLPDGTPIKNDYFRQLFRKALEECGLLFDEIDRQRSLYSCRHTYATDQLLYQKVSVYTLAEQMGTSVLMIERHYGHLTPEQAVDELTSGSVDDEYDWDGYVRDETARREADAEERTD